MKAGSLTGSSEAYDLVIVGSGAAGLTAALVAATLDLRPLVVEKADRLGGTTARSGGAVWIPHDVEQAGRYLDALIGNRSDRLLRKTFLNAGPQMLAYLEKHSEVRFEVAQDEPDYRQDLPAAALGGRAFRPLPFDGRLLGKDFERVAWPLPELMVFGKIMVTRAEVAKLLRFGVSADSFTFATRTYARYLTDRLAFSRGTRLVLGNALIARLYKSLKERGVRIWFGSRAKELRRTGDRVDGVLLESNGNEITIHANRGVVLAGGGFPHNPHLRERFLPKPVAQYSAAFEGCTGDTLELAERAGAALAGGAENALWFPSSIAKRRGGSTIVFPHIVLDRAKPGLVAIDAAGSRFVSEAVSYHEFVRAMYRSHQSVATIPAWLVCDRRFVWKYGLGLVHAHALSPASFIRTGYLKSGRTVDELAVKIGVDPGGLTQTITRNNEFARDGIDRDFHKGENPYERANGDPVHKPNPCIGPIESTPFYAVAVWPTPLGTSLGVHVTVNAQALDQIGRRIPGLYACGNDMESVMGGEYPGPGAQLGPAMTFGYLAALHAAGRSEG